jgi:chemotaxis protein CheX
VPKEIVWERRARRRRVEKAAQKSRSSRPPVAADEGEGAPPPVEPVNLPEVLDLPAAVSLAAALLERRGRPTVVDAQLPQRPGAQCLQVLMSAIKTWADDSVPLAFVNCGPLFIEHVRFLGIDSAPFTNGGKA